LGSAGCSEVCGTDGFTELKKFIYSISCSTKGQHQGLQDLVNSRKLILILEKSKRPKVKTP